MDGRLPSTMQMMRTIPPVPQFVNGRAVAMLLTAYKIARAAMTMKMIEETLIGMQKQHLAVLSSAI